MIDRIGELVQALETGEALASEGVTPELAAKWQQVISLLEDDIRQIDQHLAAIAK